MGKIGCSILWAFSKYSAYELQLPDICKLRPVFHVSQLKRAEGNHDISLDIPEQLTPVRLAEKNEEENT